MTKTSEKRKPRRRGNRFVFQTSRERIAAFNALANRAIDVRTCRLDVLTSRHVAFGTWHCVDTESRLSPVVCRIWQFRSADSPQFFTGPETGSHAGGFMSQVSRQMMPVMTDSLIRAVQVADILSPESDTLGFHFAAYVSY